MPPTPLQGRWLSLGDGVLNAVPHPSRPWVALLRRSALVESVTVELHDTQTGETTVLAALLKPAVLVHWVGAFVVVVTPSSLPDETTLRLFAADGSGETLSFPVHERVETGNSIDGPTGLTLWLGSFGGMDLDVSLGEGARRWIGYRLSVGADGVQCVGPRSVFSDVTPAWHPDGGPIARMSSRGEADDYRWTIRLDDEVVTDTIQLLAESEQFVLTWVSPEVLLVTSPDWSITAGLWLVTASNGNVAALHHGALGAVSLSRVSLSPDLTRLALLVWVDGLSVLRVVRAADAELEAEIETTAFGGSSPVLHWCGPEEVMLTQLEEGLDGESTLRTERWRVGSEKTHPATLDLSVWRGRCIQADWWNGTPHLMMLYDCDDALALHGYALAPLGVESR